MQTPCFFTARQQHKRTPELLVAEVSARSERPALDSMSTARQRGARQGKEKGGTREDIETEVRVAMKMCCPLRAGVPYQKASHKGD